MICNFKQENIKRSKIEYSKKKHFKVIEKLIRKNQKSLLLIDRYFIQHFLLSGFMSKSFYLTALLLALIQLSLTASPHDYKSQGNIILITNITNFGYSPNQKHLIVLADSLPIDTFAHYYGYRLNQKQDVKIVDNSTNSTIPSAFAFSKDGQWLVVGTNQGSVYGYQIVEGEIQNATYKYKKNIGNNSQEKGVRSISFSNGGQIAVAAKDYLVVLTVPNNQTSNEFDQKIKYNCTTILSSVAWRRNSEDIVIAGGDDANNSYFHIVDITKNPIIPQPIQNTTTEQTLSIGVFPDDDETILQGKQNDNITIYKWNNSSNNYKFDREIPNIATVGASQISITADGLYFAAELKSTKNVIAWESGLQIKPAINLKNQVPQSISPRDIMKVSGTNIALTNDGNRILFIDQQDKAQKWGICDQGQWYNPNTTPKDCVACGNGCNSCFNADNCETCPNNQTYVDSSNNCAPCSSVTNGCKECSDEKTCTGCNTNANFNPYPDSNKSCQCKVNYFDDENNCTQCDDGKNFCLECKSATYCTTCNTTYPHIEKNPDNGKCDCEFGWYLEGGKCNDCTEQTGCKDCQSATNCTVCDKANKWVQTVEGKCVCQVGFWQNGTTCTQCKNKTQNCDQCQQDGTCTKCIDKRVVNPNTKKCVCQNYTFEDPSTNECKFCDDKMKCLVCQATGNNTCIQCDYINGNRKKSPVDGKCQCKPGYTEYEDVCTLCEVKGCKQCNNQKQCSQCFTQKNFDKDPKNNSCVCIEGYIKTKDEQSCSTCAKQIPGCMKCQDLQVCQACNSGQSFIPDPNSDNKCSCIVTYFLNNTFCELCSKGYSNCEECDNNTCTKCKNGYLETDDKKNCYTCGQAIPGCDKCTDLKSCTECNATNYWQQASDNKTCVCKLGFYQNKTECKLCSIQYPYCANCSMQSGCFSCQQTFFYNSQQKICFCPDDKQVKENGKCEDKSGLSALAIIAIIVGILAVAGAAVAIIKCLKKRKGPLEDGEYEAVEGDKTEK